VPVLPNTRIHSSRAGRWLVQVVAARLSPQGLARAVQAALLLGLFLVLGCATARGPAGISEAAPDPSAVQSLYLSGVPHTDAQGNLRSAYDSASFFPRCIYHAVPGSFAAIKAAGFNCVHTWEGVGIADVIDELRSSGLQLIMHSPSDEEVRQFAADPRILGWYLDEEPTSHTYLEMRRTGKLDAAATRHMAFVSRRAAIKALDPGHPVFPLDGGGSPPGLDELWDLWNSSGDVTAHDHYPLLPGTEDIAALPRSVLRAVRLNREQKPVWITLQAFGGFPGLDDPPRMPTAVELRGMVFTAIIHGATGIILFAYDSPVTRAGHVLGISPLTAESYGASDAATPSQAAASRALWAGAASLNVELERLTPTLLSPTSSLSYTVEDLGSHRTASPIRSLLKENGGVYTLLAANVESRTVGARYRFSVAIRSVRRVHEDGSITVLESDGSTFRDELGAFAAAVYEVTFSSGIALGNSSTPDSAASSSFSIFSRVPVPGAGT